MNKQDSIRKQERAGTLERNKAIKFLYENGLSLAEIGRIYKLPRQRIHQLVKLPNRDEKRYNGFLGRFISKVIGKYRRS